MAVSHLRLARPVAGRSITAGGARAVIPSSTFRANPAHLATRPKANTNCKAFCANFRNKLPFPRESAHIRRSFDPRPFRKLASRSRGRPASSPVAQIGRRAPQPRVHPGHCAHSCRNERRAVVPRISDPQEAENFETVCRLAAEDDARPS